MRSDSSRPLEGGVVVKVEAELKALLGRVQEGKDSVSPGLHVGLILNPRVPKLQRLQLVLVDGRLSAPRHLGRGETVEDRALDVQET